jgi:hypothetical protein
MVENERGPRASETAVDCKRGAFLWPREIYRNVTVMGDEVARP